MQEQTLCCCYILGCSRTRKKWKKKSNFNQDYTGILSKLLMKQLVIHDQISATFNLIGKSLHQNLLALLDSYAVSK